MVNMWHQPSFKWFNLSYWGWIIIRIHSFTQIPKFYHKCLWLTLKLTVGAHTFVSFCPVPIWSSSFCQYDLQVSVNMIFKFLPIWSSSFCQYVLQVLAAGELATTNGSKLWELILGIKWIRIRTRWLLESIWYRFIVRTKVIIGELQWPAADMVIIMHVAWLLCEPANNSEYWWSDAGLGSGSDLPMCGSRIL